VKPIFLIVSSLLLSAACSHAGSIPDATLAISPAAEDAVAILASVKRASGGARWDSVRALRAEGDETTDGLVGPFRSVVDVTSGRFARRGHNDVFVVATGFDGHTRWRSDISGQTHDLDSDEARTVALSEAYLERRGYLFPERVPARVARLADVSAEESRAIRLEITPDGGRTMTVVIDPNTRLVDRATMELSFTTRTVRYGNYRNVDGLVLPFSADIEVHKDDAEHLAVHTYAVAEPRDADFSAPSRDVVDATLPPGASEAKASLVLDNGRLLVEARINGQGPFAFILDTGGHAILTPAMVERLGLTARGLGITSGSGSGSMTTQYAEVSALEVGGARVEKQPFLVLPLPWPFVERGQAPAIAGLLGLELFERFVVALDYDDGTLRLTRFGDAPAGTPVALQFTSDMPLAHAELDGKDGIFGIDSGNGGDVVVFSRWAMAAGIRDRYRAGSSQASMGVGGTSVEYLARTEQFKIGGLPVTALAARLSEATEGAFAARSEAGNLGQTVLSRFNVVFDYRREAMYLTPRAHPAVVQTPRAGFTAMKLDAKKFSVLAIASGGPAEAAGLKSGDAIVSIDGVTAEELAGRDLAAKVRQPVGTPLRLGVLRAGARLDLTLMLRDLI
jgi:hypothetical protein